MRPFTRIPNFGTPVLTPAWLASFAATLGKVFRDIADMPFNRSSDLTVSDTGTADTEFSVAHGLGRVPAGFLVTNSSKAASVYKSGTAWTKTTIYLKCNAANANINLVVY